jgi:hypothetical protein
MNQVFISIFLLKNTGSKKIYEYKFSGKESRSSESALSLIVCHVLGVIWQCATPLGLWA